MPELEITDPQPTHVQDERTALRSDLAKKIPPKQPGKNLLVATWNIRAFGNVTKKWDSQASDSPRRDFRSIVNIAEILSCFDVIAVQEVKDNIRALRYVMKLLGPTWGFLMTDVTLGDEGNAERMAFVFDTDRVRPSGLAGELVVPPEWLARLDSDALNRQFVRTPYAVSFVDNAGQTFILVTLHVIWGDSSAARIRELKGIAKWLADWARREQSWGHNLIALGDFNIDRKGDALYLAFTSTGLTPPAELDAVPRTIFQDPTEAHFYDQIAWFAGAGGVPKLTLKYNNKAGGYDFRPVVFPGMPAVQLSFRMSDHFPLWVEFS